jgi:ACS family hexuronate transporter-like MFS transporter
MKPQNRKWVIVGTIFLAIICNYLDRQLLSNLKDEILLHFSINDLQYAWIVNIFLICYAVMYPISGILVDKFGSKKVMLAGILTWSLACIGGGLSQNVTQFTICRGILGLAEPTIFAGQIVAVTVWFEKRQRALANSLCTIGGSLGAVIAPILMPWLINDLHLQWNHVFLLAGCLGVLIAIAWTFIYQNPPKEILDKTMQRDDKNLEKASRAFKWGELWGTKSMWGVLLIRLISDPVWYFICFWLPGYLRNMGTAQGMTESETLKMIQFIGGIPFLVGAIGGLLTSAWSDRMARHGMDSLKARKKMMITTVIAAPLCIVVPYVSNAATLGFGTRIGLVVAIFSIVAVMCLSWLYTICVVIAEAFPVKNVASVVGITAGAGAIGGCIFNYFLGSLLSTMGNTLFLIMGLMHIVAAVLLWRMIRPEVPKPLAETAKAA